MERLAVSKKQIVILIGFIVCGCAVQTADAPQRAKDVDVIFDEPKIEYESPVPIDILGRVEHGMEVLEKVLDRAAEKGADGMIDHSVRTRGRVAGGADAYATVGRCWPLVAPQNRKIQTSCASAPGKSGHFRLDPPRPLLAESSLKPGGGASATDLA